MTDTQKRIKALKKQLPSVKGKVVAMATSLLLAVVMLTSVSFAWFTMSGSPELGGVKTTISANGNLEIALSDKDGLAPEKSGIGDSFSADGQKVHLANTSWGNLINLSENYGIENLILRPAKLDTSYPALLTGVKYSEDGRFEATATDFGFTSWAKDENGNMGFLVPKEDAYGVRAISSVGYEKVNGQGKSPLQVALENANAKNAQAKAQYEALMDKNTEEGAANLAVITQLVNAFVAEQLGSSSVNFGNDLPKIYQMLDGFYKAVCSYGDALAELAKIQQKVYCEAKNLPYTPFTRETLIAASSDTLTKNGVSLSTLAKFKKIEKDTREDLSKIEGLIEDYKQGTAITWNDMYPIVQHLIDLGSVKIAGKTLSEIKSNITGALGMLSGTQPVEIGAGNMYTFEELSGARMNGNGPVLVKVKALFVTINGSLATTLKPTDAALYRTDEDATKTKGEIGDFKGAMKAQDTYGMVLDLWVRTNAANSYLSLDGLLDIEVYYEQYQGRVLMNGKMVSVPLWTYEYKTGNTIEAAGQVIEETAEMTVYVIPQSLDPQDPNRAPKQYDIQIQVSDTETKTVKISEGIFYDYKTNDPVFRRDAKGNLIPSGQTNEDGLPIYTLIDHTDVSAYMEKKENVLGFQGSNRVDDDYGDGLPAGEVSATQGSGSCYIFYADTPEAAAEAKELLRNLKFAFLDANNTVLARAEMDVDHMLEEAGKYVVPIRIVTDSYVVDGVNCIMPLEQNVATRVSVLVYLDGTALENSMVMSKDSILGSLNIQFASTAKPKDPMTNLDLEMQTISLSAAVTKNNFEYNGSASTTELKANIYGVTPKLVQAYFQRQINATQGSRLDPITLKERTGADGTYWGADARFLTPGTYVLRTLWIDGVEYNLPEPVTVTVEGLEITRVSFTESMALTADRYVDRDIEIAIQADDKTRPDQVQVRFKDENDNYTSGTLTFDPSSDLWKGKVRFTSSGTYTLTYAVMDGEYTEIPANLQKTFTAYMGLRARVVLVREGGLTFKFRGLENISAKVDILTDSDEVMKSLTNVNLYYGRRGATSLADSLHAELKWENGQYCGTLPIEDIGTFVFAQLTVGDNVITFAESAPTIVSQPTDPPSYEGGNLYQNGADITLPANNILALNDTQNLFFKVETKNATTAYKVVLLLKDYNNQMHEVVIEEGVGEDGASYFEDNTYYFAIPDNMTGTRNGQWTVTGVKLYGVYDAAGNYYGEADPENPELDPYKESFDLEFTSTFTLIDEFSVSVPNTTVTLGKDANGKITGSFMQEQPLGTKIEFGVDFTGFTSLPAGVSIENAKLILHHNANTSVANGGYSYSNSSDNPNATVSLDLELKNMKLVLTDDAVNKTLRLAGTYYGVVTFDLRIEGVNAPISFTKEFRDSKLVEVWSVKPTVAISGINPAGPVKVDHGTQSGTQSDETATWNATTATVFFGYKYESGACGGGGTHTYTRPKVTIRLTGKGAAQNVILSFGSGSYVYGGTQGAYEWSADGDCTREIGYLQGTSERTPAGTIEADKLVLIFNAVEYTVALPEGSKITINNQY